jgi:hypothetical protein
LHPRQTSPEKPVNVKATLTGFLRGGLAPFTAASGTMPPSQLSAICFGSLPGIVVLALKPGRMAPSFQARS